MAKKIFLFGLSGNMPHLRHRQIAELLAPECDKFIVVPCGVRPDKLTVNDTSSVDRAVMCDMNFRNIPNVEVLLDDLEKEEFTRAYDLDQQFRRNGDEVWHVVGSELIEGGIDKSDVSTKWHRGRELFKQANFWILYRDGRPSLSHYELPPQRRYDTRVRKYISSSSLRKLVSDHKPIDDFVLPEVAQYIERRGLYRGLPVQSKSILPAIKERRRLLVVWGHANSDAQETASRLKSINESNPELIIVIGGDGTMLRAIRKYWRLRVPFFGINRGHIGFLMNELVDADSNFIRLHQTLIVYQSPLLSVNGHLAFNDVWVKGIDEKIIYVQVFADGKLRLKDLAGDGLIVSTPAGSTGYARKAGGQTIKIGESSLLLTGIAARPFVSAPVDINSEIRIEAINSDRWPMQAFADGEKLGQMKELRIRTSRIAAQELAFLPEYDLTEKSADF